MAMLNKTFLIKCSFLMFISLTLIVLPRCSPTSPEEETMIRMADNLYNWLTFRDLAFLALSKTDFTSLSGQELQAYDKHQADWYIDYQFKEGEETWETVYNGKICHVTAYKKFNESLGGYYYLIRFRFGGYLASSRTLRVRKGKNTIYTADTSPIPTVEIGQP